MFCPKCGNQVSDNAAFCSACGQAMPKAADEETVANGTANESFANGNTAPEGESVLHTVETIVLEENPSSGVANALAIIGIVLGAIGTAFGWIVAIFGYMLGGGSLALALVAKSKNPTNKKWIPALVLAITTLSLSVFSSMIGVLLTLE